MLFIVATPVGNLSEITLRALEVLKSVDLILCEDCRHSLKLLNHYGIQKPLEAHHKFNEKGTVDKIIGQLSAGRNIALISDAGMPCISDPGLLLVRACIEAGCDYTVVSGASSILNAVVLSGFSTKFLFYGFLREKQSAKRAELEKLKDADATLVFFVPPHDLTADLSLMTEIFGSRKACIVREISKLHEEVIHFVLGDGRELPAKGEIVVLIEGAGEKENENLKLTTEEHLKKLLEAGYDEKTAVKQTAKDRVLQKDAVYKLLVRMKGK
jgi:16S rRNA (cytidine1402-2'-O)-methyltransferase